MKVAIASLDLRDRTSRSFNAPSDRELKGSEVLADLRFHARLGASVIECLPSEVHLTPNVNHISPALRCHRLHRGCLPI